MYSLLIRKVLATLTKNSWSSLHTFADLAQKLKCLHHDNTTIVPREAIDNAPVEIMMHALIGSIEDKGDAATKVLLHELTEDTDDEPTSNPRRYTNREQR